LCNSKQISGKTRRGAVSSMWIHGWPVPLNPTTVHWPQHNLHTHPFNGPLSGTTQVSQYQEGKTNLDFTEARDSEWQWNPLGLVQACTSLQTDNHASTPLLSFFTGRMPFLPPNQQRQSTDRNLQLSYFYRSLQWLLHCITSFHWNQTFIHSQWIAYWTSEIYTLLYSLLSVGWDKLPICCRSPFRT